VTDAATAVAKLVAYYERAAARLRDLPMYHAALQVEAVGFREHEGRLVGVIVAPWFMNLTVLPSPTDLATWRKGSLARLSFPSGVYEFSIGDADENGLVATCSLFSLMHEFGTQDAARAAAVAACEAPFERPAPPAGQTRQSVAPSISRRRFLRGG
jgi:[NiFe] hydrogenase assembly HybE family chaperone